MTTAGEQVASKPPKQGPSSKGGAEPSPSTTSSPRAVIANRLESAVREFYPPLGKKNRSSDLVPLTREFEDLRRKLRALTAAAKAYPPALAGADRAHLDVSALSFVVPSFCVSG